MSNIEQNIIKIKHECKRGVYFGVSYIQRLCKIGYRDANDCIGVCLNIGIIRTDKNCAYKYMIIENSKNE